MAQRAGQDVSGNVSAATRQLLIKLDQEDLHTIVPDELVMYHFKQAGCNCDDDPQLIKLLAVAGQRFLSSVVNDALQVARRRAAPVPGRKHKEADKRLVLGPEDAAAALREYGINCRPAPYFVNPADR